MKININGPEMEITFNRGEQTMGMTPLEAGVKIDSLIKKYRFDHPAVDYKVAMRRVLEVNPKLKELYTRTQVVMPADAAEFSKDAGTGEENQAVRETVNELVLLQMEYTKETDYGKAMDKVFEARPELKEAYARS